ncbi:MAG: DUF2334 domain-containing protein [Clostridia bacterium]|nr:DUF2334 domain-containing protein [Clostridia bacterium]
MKKLLSITLSLMLLVSLLGGLGATAAETVLFEDNFEGYEEGTVIDTKNSKYDVVTKNDDKEAWGIVESDDTDNKMLKFTITADGKTGPRVVKYIDITGLKDLTIAAKAKTSGGASCSIQLYTDGALNAALVGGNKADWCEVKHELNFETLTFVSYKDGKEAAKGELKPITDTTKLDIRFFQTIDNTKCTYWDDIVISTSGEKLDENATPAPKPEEPKPEEPKPETPAITPSTAVKAPYIAGPNGESVVILKVDDLTVANYEAFKSVYEVMHKHGLVAGFGAITYKCEDFTDAQWAEIKTWVDNGFEIWHHGYKHDGKYVDGVFQNDADFIGRSAEDMEMYLNHGIDLFAAHGITIQSVGAPYNKIDDTFINLVNTKFADKITSVQYGNSKLNSAYNLGNRLNMEVSGKDALTAIQETYSKNPGKPYYVVQIHAFNHDGADSAVFEQAILYLKEQGCIFMTPTGYIEYCIAAANKPQVIEVIDETAAGGRIRVVYNGEDVDFEKYDSVYPVIENGRTLIPIRALSETVGAEVGWIEATQKITITKNNTQIIMFLNNPNATANGETVVLDVPPATRSDRTMVPLRFASESLGLEVKWTQK